MRVEVARYDTHTHHKQCISPLHTEEITDPLVAGIAGNRAIVEIMIDPEMTTTEVMAIGGPSHNHETIDLGIIRDKTRDPPQIITELVPTIREIAQATATSAGVPDTTHKTANRRIVMNKTPMMIRCSALSMTLTNTRTTSEAVREAMTAPLEMSLQ